jgi:hypothetical protein
MTAIYLLLYAAALILFVLAAFGVPARRVNLLALGLAAWVLVPLIHAARALG